MYTEQNRIQEVFMQLQTKIPEGIFYPPVGQDSVRNLEQAFGIVFPEDWFFFWTNCCGGLHIPSPVDLTLFKIEETSIDGSDQNVVSPLKDILSSLRDIITQHELFPVGIYGVREIFVRNAEEDEYSLWIRSLYNGNGKDPKNYAVMCISRGDEEIKIEYYLSSLLDLLQAASEEIDTQYW